MWLFPILYKHFGHPALGKKIHHVSNRVSDCDYLEIDVSSLRYCRLFFHIFSRYLKILIHKLRSFIIHSLTEQKSEFALFFFFLEVH